MDELLFTPSAVLGLLTSIEEIADKEISFQELESNQIVVTVGNSSYTVDTSNATEVSVDDYAVEEVADANEEGYELLQDDGVFFDEEDEPVEGGIIKELAKTLLVGGLVRLTSNAIKNS